ncbi:MAG TPA: histidinol-phosphate transaminase [Candidatus Dormibacteraeota bacterium]|nr:histidinol-phosphate transaminase [Candidatus Dormibacteraeota bacterium]
MSERFLKPALREFVPYVPGRQPPELEGWIKLNTNEAPWPPSPRVLDAVREAVDGDLRLYPHPLAVTAREAIARFHGLSPAQVALGNGADDLIAMCFRAFVPKGARVAYLEPSYPLFAPLCRMHEAEPSVHALGPTWEVPDSFIADPAPLKFLVNPNSPTASWVDRAVVREVVRHAPGVVVLDEAYVDFAPATCIDLLAEGWENLIVLRTFSKAYALAGMRVGYAASTTGLISALDLVKDSYNVDRLAIVAAVAAIEDREYHDRLVAYVVEERAWLGDRLREAGFHVGPSATNFLFAQPPPGWDAARLVEELGRRRILIRHFGHGLAAGWVRVTVGTREQHLRLLEALKEVMVGDG